MGAAFDKHAEEYDSWFMKNQNALFSKALLIEEMLKEEKGKNILSVSCGSGLFEYILKDKGIGIRDCVEPSEMGPIAEKRGLKVKRCYAEDYQSNKPLMNCLTPIESPLPNSMKNTLPIVTLTPLTIIGEE
ncbi:class I SAM-dependent methyltransferase [Saccharolobus islandicus]|uniref:SAM-dependent methyltransferase n=2 Tax=Saccharolobus islandicus TaxID=43080 RepID=M9U441_SACIS|nr:hypothetical protein [Sulfolobus islandicus]ADX81709.1 hypothetical protein SiH_0338 [Sulfolobus islandicus HVE10/4]AGJ61794.1 SAM-dependent methyltransferase [Sulfolobus islandicus LAL14/1]WCM36926.1 hypothetical protein GO599_05265 [Sulfolobus islandicus]